MTKEKVREMIESIEAKCTCGCNFSDACLCWERREGVELTKKDLLKKLK